MILCLFEQRDWFANIDNAKKIESTIEFAVKHLYNLLFVEKNKKAFRKWTHIAITCTVGFIYLTVNCSPTLQFGGRISSRKAQNSYFVLKSNAIKIFKIFQIILDSNNLTVFIKNINAIYVGIKISP